MNTENEDEILFREEFDGIIRKSQTLEAFKPSYEDIIRFRSQKTRLLLDIECYALPLELQIDQVIDGGAVFSFSNGFQRQWLKTEQVSAVLHIFPPRELAIRLGELKGAEQKKTQKRELKTVREVMDEIKPLTQKQLDDVLNEFKNLGTKKKCKKKKNCPTESSK